MMGVMKSLTQLLQRQFRRPARPVYFQPELPLGGTRLDREDCRLVFELRKMRESLLKT